MLTLSSIKHKASPVFLGLILISICVTFSGCTQTHQPAAGITDTFPPLPSRGFYMGVLPNPAEGQPLEDAYAQAAIYAEFVPVWGRPTPFYEMSKDLGGGWGEIFVNQLILENGMFPVINLSFMGENLSLAGPPGIEKASLSDPDWRAAYTEAALDAVRTANPHYISLGNEVNRWYENYGAEAQDPNGFQHYVSLYEEIYDAIHAISPETVVFCIFAREIVSENRPADLQVLQMFDPDKLDLLVFTSYPYALQNINRPSDLPDDYYARSLAYLPGKSLGFSELGWPSLDAFGGEQSQADFLNQVTGRLTLEQGMDLRLLGWAWLHDIDQNDTIGLLRCDGSEKLAYQVWKDFSANP